MNVNDYTLKVSYKIGGVVRTVGGNDENLTFLNCCVKDRIFIKVKASENVELLTAVLIYDKYFENNERIFVNGYQSWTTSREYKRGDIQYGLRNLSKLPLIKAFSGASGDYGFTEYGRDLFHSFSYTYLNNDGNLEFFGSLNERTGYTVFYSDVRENVFAVAKDVEGLIFNGEYELFDVYYTEGNYESVFDKYFAALTRKNTGRVTHFAGYTSWYNYFQNISEEIILRDLNGIASVGKSANVFQIDDGYETKVGDWAVDEAKFPNGMRYVSDAIHEKNLVAGLWLAPFSAQFNADIVKEHPEWIIKNKKGKNLIAGVSWGGFYALDIEKQEVREYIKAYFDKVFDEWNFDMVKLDFLYSACIIPRNGKTRGQLMCEGMDFLRLCCRDKIILGCGVPLWPSFGIVDACRISCDVELSFKDRFYTKVTNQEIVSAKMAMNNTLFRRHLNKRIFANDPDVFFLRDGGAKAAKFTLEQKKLLAKINNMCGDVLFVSDNVNDYGVEQREILLDSYKQFDGKILDVEYVAVDKIAITYIEHGVKLKLTYNTLTGEQTTVSEV